MTSKVEVARPPSDAKARLLQLWRARALTGFRHETDIPARPSSIPASHAQEALWLLEQLGARSPAYNIATGLRFTLPLDVSALNSSLSAVVSRHESLRTRLVDTGDVLVQQIDEAGTFVLEIEDRSDSETKFQHLMPELVEYAREPFDLAAGPLFRAKLYQLGQNENLLIINMHHAVTDGWSLGVIFRELSMLMADHAGKDEIQLPTVSLQYADWSLAQRRALQSGRLESEIAFWRDTLKDLARLDIPTDFERPALPSTRAERHQVRLDPVIYASAVKCGRALGATTFMTLLAAILTVLHRHTSTTDLAVGVPYANRSVAGSADAVGYYVNMVILRVDMSGDPSFAEALGRVRQASLRTFEHGAVPLALLASRIREKSPRRFPFVDVFFNLNNSVAEGLQGRSMLGVEAIEVFSGASQTDLEISLYERNGSLEGHIDFAADLFKANKVSWLFSQVTRVLAGFVANPNQRLSELSLTGPDGVGGAR